MSDYNDWLSRWSASGGPRDDFEPRDSTGGENAQLSVGEQAYRAAGSPELPPDPVPQRVSSGDPLNSQQFADQLETANVRRSAPLVHGPDKTTWFAEGDRDDR